VAANSRLRRDAEAAARRLGLPLFTPPLSLCTDNAAMIAASGFVGLRRGVRATWDLNAEPSLALT
jgi:N6-L-threonylcarbamoyladenine synthase